LVPALITQAERPGFNFKRVGGEIFQKLPMFNQHKKFTRISLEFEKVKAMRERSGAPTSVLLQVCMLSSDHFPSRPFNMGA